MKFCVITRIRSLEGILADDFIIDLAVGKVVWLGIPDRFIPSNHSETPIRVPVFEEGEILVTDGSREIGGAGRKPSKWDVDYEMFDNVEDAIKKSREVLERENE